MKKQAKTYIVFVNDHSGSMENIKNAARNDYNQNIEAIKDGATHEKLDTIVSVIGIGALGSGSVERQVVISNPHVLNQKADWPCPGNTPLYDALADAINLMNSVPDINEEHVSVLVMTTTDGEEYGSRKYNLNTVKNMIRAQQGTGRWTFVFRVPKGGDSSVRAFGVPEGNIQQWETTAAGMAATTAVSQTAMRSFMSQQVSGKRSSGSFYSDASNVNVAALEDVTKEISLYLVPPEFNGKWIRDFILTKRTKYLKGSAFYQLTKTEARVQPDKHILIMDIATEKFFSGDKARDMIGLPRHQNARLNPGDHGKFQIFIQSNSVNRHLVAGTGVAYWASIGTEFTEEEMTRYDPKPVVIAPPPKSVASQLPVLKPTNKPTKSPLVPQKKEEKRVFYRTRSLAREWSRKTGRPVHDAGADQPKDQRWYSDPVTN